MGNETPFTSIAELIDFIERIYHIPLRHNIIWIENETKQLLLEYGKKYPELENIHHLFIQFKSEVLHHIEEEENDFFPVLRQIEDCALGIRDFNDCDLQKFETIIHRLESEHEHFDTYVMDIVEVFKNLEIRYENIFIYDHLLGHYQMLEKETMRHTEIENTKLHPLAKSMFKTVCNIT